MGLPTPYYERDGITIYHGDCREILPHLPPVDLVLTDPPYGICDAPNKQDDGTGHRPTGRNGAVNSWHAPSVWDKQLILPDFDNVPLIGWFGHWRKRPDVEKAYGKARCEIIWVKDTHVGPPCPAAMQDERIWVFGESFTPRRFETTVWQVPIIPTWAHRRHKNEKPEALMKRALLWLPGETILDPFMGYRSGQFGTEPQLLRSGFCHPCKWLAAGHLIPGIIQFHH